MTLGIFLRHISSKPAYQAAKRAFFGTSFCFMSALSCSTPDSIYAEGCGDSFLVTNTHAVEGYSDAISYFPGDEVVIFAHVPNGHLFVDLIRHGITDTPMMRRVRAQGTPQNYSSCAYANGADWQETVRLTLPEELPSGYYSVKLSDREDTFLIPIVVRSLAASGDVVLLASTNTWQAYNDWGGASFYAYHWASALPYESATKIHFRRPHPPPASIYRDELHLRGAELKLSRWLESSNRPYDLIADTDLHNDFASISRYKVLILSTHPEYWSERMYDHLEAFQRQGGNLMYLAGNGLYRKVTLDGAQMELRRDGSRHTHDGTRGGLWRDLGRPEARVLGVQFTRAGQLTYHPYVVHDETHWIYAGTGLENGDAFGVAGASGYETDKISASSPPAAQLLAKGTNLQASDELGRAQADPNGGAAMTCFTTPGGGKVFSAGSVSYGGALSGDPVLARITQNVLDEFTQ